MCTEDVYCSFHTTQMPYILEMFKYCNIWEEGGDEDLILILSQWNSWRVHVWTNILLVIKLPLMLLQFLCPEIVCAGEKEFSQHKSHSSEGQSIPASSGCPFMEVSSPKYFCCSFLNLFFSCYILLEIMGIKIEHAVLGGCNSDMFISVCLVSQFLHSNSLMAFLTLLSLTQQKFWDVGCKPWISCRLLFHFWQRTFSIHASYCLAVHLVGLKCLFPSLTRCFICLGAGCSKTSSCQEPCWKYFGGIQNGQLDLPKPRRLDCDHSADSHLMLSFVFSGALF